MAGIKLPKIAPDADLNLRDTACVYGTDTSGKVLAGKKLVVSMTIGAPEEAYGEGAAVHVDDLPIPAKGTCALTSMEFAGYEYTCGVSYASRMNHAAREEIATAGCTQAARAVKLVEGL